MPAPRRHKQPTKLGIHKQNSLFTVFTVIKATVNVFAQSYAKFEACKESNHSLNKKQHSNTETKRIHVRRCCTHGNIIHC